MALRITLPFSYETAGTPADLRRLTAQPCEPLQRIGTVEEMTEGRHHAGSQSPVAPSEAFLVDRLETLQLGLNQLVQDALAGVPWPVGAWRHALGTGRSNAISAVLDAITRIPCPARGFDAGVILGGGSFGCQAELTPREQGLPVGQALTQLPPPLCFSGENGSGEGEPAFASFRSPAGGRRSG